MLPLHPSIQTSDDFSPYNHEAEFEEVVSTTRASLGNLGFLDPWKALAG